MRTEKFFNAIIGNAKKTNRENKEGRIEFLWNFKNPIYVVLWYLKISLR